MQDSAAKVLHARTFKVKENESEIRMSWISDSPTGSGRNQRLSQPQEGGHGQEFGTASRGLGTRFRLDGTDG